MAPLRSVGSIGYTFNGWVPSPDDKCARCGRGWTIKDFTSIEKVIVDYHETKVDCSRASVFLVDRGKSDEAGLTVGEWMHVECKRMEHADEAREWARKVFAEATGTGDSLSTLTAIPNEYCPCPSCAPWFLVDDWWGRIKIGRRKSVWNIDWSAAPRVKKPDFFDAEGVTVGETHIHAYTTEKVVEYIAALFKTALA